MKPLKQEKVYYSIKEVSELLGVSYTTLRYWEQEFDSLNPKKTDKNTRQYREEDVKELQLIHHLLKHRKMTIAGAKQVLKENRASVIKTEALVSHLKSISQELTLLREELDELERKQANIEASVS